MDPFNSQSRTFGHCERAFELDDWERCHKIQFIWKFISTSTSKWGFRHKIREFGKKWFFPLLNLMNNRLFYDFKYIVFWKVIIAVLLILNVPISFLFCQKKMKSWNVWCIEIHFSEIFLTLFPCSVHLLTFSSVLSLFLNDSSKFHFAFPYAIFRCEWNLKQQKFFNLKDFISIPFGTNGRKTLYLIWYSKYDSLRILIFLTYYQANCLNPLVHQYIRPQHSWQLVFVCIPARSAFTWNHAHKKCFYFIKNVLKNS